MRPGMIYAHDFTTPVIFVDNVIATVDKTTLKAAKHCQIYRQKGSPHLKVIIVKI